MEPFGRPSVRQWVMVDMLLAAFGLVAGVTAVAFGHAPGPGPAWDALRYVAVVLVAGSVAFRRRRPLVALGAVLVGFLLASALGLGGPGVPATALCVYSVAVAAPRSRRLLSLVVATMLVAGLITPRGLRFTDVIFGPAFVVVAWLIGENVRTRRAFAAEREREREERILRAAADERLRIARELHDVVAHSMSIIAVQSGVGRVVMDSQPDEARKALAAIESTSRQALQEMRRLLGVLRQPESMDLSSPLGPAPGLDRVDELVSQASQAGVAVSVQVSGSPRELPPGVDLSAYRIIQEALTNIVRHVGPSNASVAIRYSPDDVSVEVLDDGGSRGADASSSSDGTGHGLVGMRERVGLFGGSLEVGPRRGGGFRVFACLPAAAS